VKIQARLRAGVAKFFLPANVDAIPGDLTLGVSFRSKIRS
jgi:hypothetical protein